MSLCSLLLLVGLTASSVFAYPHYGSANFNGLPHAPAPRTVRWVPAADKKGVFYMNRIGPSTADVYISNADGSNEQKLLGNSSIFEFHPTFSPDGEWVTFTSERNGDGQADIYRSRLDGSGFEKLLATPSVEDVPVLSPDGSKVAFVSTADGYRANIVVLDLTTGEQTKLTNNDAVSGTANTSSPNSYLRPSWSPDGEWLAFSSDRNTQWRGHGNGTGWEHTQQLAIYVIKSDGTEFRQVTAKDDYCLGSPKWSPDGQRIIYYELTVEDTWNAHGFGAASTNSQIVSVDVATGTDRVAHTSWAGLKMAPQFITNDIIGYLVKAGANEGVNYTSISGAPLDGFTAFKRTALRNPSWSSDGKTVVYEKLGYDNSIRPQNKPLYSWQEDWDYRFTDVFPQLSQQGRLALTNKVTDGSNQSIVAMQPDGSEQTLVFDSGTPNVIPGQPSGSRGGAAYQPAWSPDGEWVALGFGSYFQARAQGPAVIIRAFSNGSYYEVLTDGTVNSGYPSYSPDGRYLVYREWGGRYGLTVIDLNDKSSRILTNATDNLPGWSPDGTKILTTRRVTYTNFDIVTMNPDGTEETVLTGESLANDAHAVWTADNRILYNSGMYGFRDEAAIYDNTFQPYGQILVMNKDGSDKTMLTDSLWEDAMPLYVPNEFLE